MTQQPPDLEISAEQMEQMEAWSSQFVRRSTRLGRIATAREWIEIGRQLLLLKRVVPHGMFGRRIKELGLTSSDAQRRMEAARRFSGAPEAFFNAVGSVSKMVELLSWDGADALAEGKNVGGVNFGLVAQMSARELRAEIRFQRERSRAPVRAPTRPVRTASLTDEEERMLSRYRKCNAEGRTALVELAGLLAQAPT